MKPPSPEPMDQSHASFKDMASREDATPEEGTDMAPQGTKDLGRGPDLGIHDACECDDPLAVCLRTVCERPDVDCRTSSCPQGYICTSANYCRCDDPDAPRCRPLCSTMADCNREELCDSSGHCVRQSECTLDSQCPYRMGCHNSYCAQNGEKKTGEACDSDVECDSGHCPDGICGVRCTLDRDCPTGQSCSETAKNVCVGSNPPCSVTCGENEDCRGTECISERCNWTGDCSQGVCHLTPGLRTGNCQGDTKPCKAREFQTVKDDAYCRIAVVCDPKDPKACEPPYTCEKDGFTRNPYRRNVCSRKLEP